LYYSCLIKIYKFSRRNSLKSASLYRGGLVDAAVVGLVEAAVVGLVDAAIRVNSNNPNPHMMHIIRDLDYLLFVAVCVVFNAGFQETFLSLRSVIWFVY
jgi:uncharacterized membrane protein